MAAGYRRNGAVGWIVPPRSNETVIEEAFRIRPPGMGWCLASLGMQEFGSSHFDDALRVLEDAAVELAARQVDGIVYSGMPLTATQHPDYHREVVRRIHERTGTAIPVVTDTDLVLDALRTLGASRVSLITPYQPDTLRRVAEVFSNAGFSVADTRGHDWSLAELITRPDDDTAYYMAQASLAEHPETDALYLGCPQWPVVGNIGRLEATTGLPVVTQVQAMVWWAQTRLGVQPADGDSESYGRLLTTRART